MQVEWNRGLKPIERNTSIAGYVYHGIQYFHPGSSIGAGETAAPSLISVETFETNE